MPEKVLTLADLENRPTVTVEEAAAMLGLSRSWSYQMAREGRFPARTVKAGSRVRVVAADLARLLAPSEAA